MYWFAVGFIAICPKKFSRTSPGPRRANEAVLTQNPPACRALVRLYSITINPYNPGNDCD
jgi:hypothetical protein